MKHLYILLFLCTTVAFSQSKKHFITITFSDGPLQETHTFYPEKGNFASQANIEFFEGASNVNASKLMTKDGFQIHYINRYFLDKPTVGTHQPKPSTSGCGSLNFIDLKGNQTYDRINGDFTGCSTTKITKVTPWKEGVVKKRRVVSGEFEDTLTMEIRMDDGSKKTVTSNVKVSFSVNQSKMK